MATTVTEKPLFIAGEWVETGEWQEVRSPYSGEVVGRVVVPAIDSGRAKGTSRSARPISSLAVTISTVAGSPALSSLALPRRAASFWAR